MNDQDHAAERPSPVVKARVATARQGLGEPLGVGRHDLEQRGRIVEGDRPPVSGRRDAADEHELRAGDDEVGQQLGQIDLQKG